MNRTAPPAQTAPAQPTFVISPAPTAPAPAPAVTANWPLPSSQQTPTETGARPRRTAGGRGMPVGPVLAGAGNVTALTLTAAYQYGGPVAAATTGALMAAGATGLALRRRTAVRRPASTRGASRGVLRSATGGGSRGAARAGRTGSGGASRGATGSERGGSQSATRKTPRGALASVAGRTGAPRKAGATHSASGRVGPPWRGGRHEQKVASGAGTGLLGSGKNRRGATTSTATTAGAAGRRTDARGRGDATRGGNTPATHRNSPGRTGTVKAAVGRAARAAGRGAGHFTKKAAVAGWNATGPARAATKQAAIRAAKAAAAGIARQARKVPGALADGLLATSAGLLSGLWHRSWSAGAGRLRDVWRKLRARRARKQAENTPEPAATLAPVGHVVRRPTSAHHISTTAKGGPLMSGGHHFVAPAMEMARIAASYQPQGMLQVGEDFSGLSEALELHASAMKTTVENADASWPLDPTIVDLMRQIYGLQMKAAELARELRPAFEQLHDVDLDRLRNPRKGAQAESMWDVRSNL
ncbi:hypothetical protein ACF05T_28290 [Streptomyces lateritius]|uniref:Uncharacterized protein n=1 Tax=Streptomyces lateritius TaxID=67313 RepID=A0ABW6YJC6_9ACTN